MKKKWRIVAGVGLALLVILGFGTRVTVCASCEGQGPIELTWYGMRALSTGDRLFDEYGSTGCGKRSMVDRAPMSGAPGLPSLWRDAGNTERSSCGAIEAPPCEGWRTRTRNGRLAWESVRRLPFEAQSVPRARLEELGAVVWDEQHRVKPVPREVLVSWWRKNQDWIQPR